ncbi:MAG: hypothetical protein IJH71_11290 [Eubacterium sp.]|nr:hypothetical protein [Eubacterium sp.]
MHQELSGIFFEEYTDDEINDRDLDWKVEFYNRRKLDHIAYGTKDTPLHHYDNLYWLMIGIENMLAVDIGSKHIKSMCETKKEQIGKPAVVSEEMRSVYFDIMSKLVDKVMTKNEQPEKNIMISPLSLMFAMSILLEASDGDTQKEINAFFNNQHLCVAEGLKSLIEDSNRTISQLKTANAL